MGRTVQTKICDGWKKAARILAACSLLLAMTACADKGPSVEETPTVVEGSVSDTDTVGYREAGLAIVNQAVKVNLYEITDNNFVQGIDERYDGKILGELLEAVKGLSFAEGVATPDDREAKYHIIFINKDENYLLDIMVGENGRAWCGDGVFQPSEILDDWISARIKETEE